MHASPNVLKSWFLAARPKTWIAGMSPVLIGMALAASKGIDWPIAILCLLFSWTIQVGTNFANDYFDFIKGTDNANRVGPKRAAQSGWISLPALKRGIIGIFALAAFISLPLLYRGGLWGSSIVALSILFGILYTGGPKPLGYLGLGELLVLIFYGPVATLGTYYVLTFDMNALALWASLPPGLLSCAILIANNIRDETSDRLAHKRTLAVRFGRTFAQWEYALTIGAAALIPAALALLGLAPARWLFCALVLPAAWPALKRAFSAESPQELAPLLPMTALILQVYTAIFALVGH
ncbi:MAG: 1,4-dihydroxy-2-naphthoate polyprenyltransferase [Verrucomicrobia bacterium]|nr:1,4-dihydroxy-2-naphthoate polyprenyltransferase [Verrucomicrobiota bacterium]